MAFLDNLLGRKSEGILDDYREKQNGDRPQRNEVAFDLINNKLKNFTSITELANVFAQLGDAIVVGIHGLSTPDKRTDEERTRLYQLDRGGDLVSRIDSAEQVARTLRDYANACVSGNATLAEGLLAQLPVSIENLDDPESDLQMIAQRLGEKLMQNGVKGQNSELVPGFIDFSDIDIGTIITRKDAIDAYDTVVKRIRAADFEKYPGVYQNTKEEYLSILDIIFTKAKNPDSPYKDAATGEEIIRLPSNLTRTGNLRAVMTKLLEVIEKTNEAK